MLRSRQKAVLVSLVILLWSLTGCGDEQSFMAIELREEMIADFEDFELRGQERLVFRTTVTEDMGHPHFEGRWTNLNREVDVDLYVMRAADYDPALSLEAHENVFWTTAAEEGVVFGSRRATSMEIHPKPGEWVLVFFNPQDDTPTTVAELSSEIKLTYFK